MTRQQLRMQTSLSRGACSLQRRLVSMTQARSEQPRLTEQALKSHFIAITMMTMLLGDRSRDKAPSTWVRVDQHRDFRLEIES